MTRVTTCPNCIAQLSVPDSAPSDSTAVCAYCGSEFTLSCDAMRELRSVSLIESSRETQPAETLFSSQATLPDGIGDMPTLSSLFERFRDNPQFDRKDYDETADPDERSELADEVANGANENAHDPFDFDTDALGIEEQPKVEDQVLKDWAPSLAGSEPDAAERAFVAEVVSVAQSQRRRMRGSASVARQIVGVVGGGAIGLTLGYFALLWWRGPDGDLLGISDQIPAAILPTTFDASHDDSALASAEKDPAPPAPQSNAVKQAKYVTSAPAPITPREQAEPRPIQPQAAQPLIVEATVRNSPTYTLEQLSAALQQVEEAREGLLDGSLTDTVARRVKGESYVKLCQIAESLTFLDDESDARTAEERQRGQQFFVELLQADAARAEIGQIAVRWIDFPKRPHGGVFFAGRVLSCQPAGSAYELQLELAGDEQVIVLVPEPSHAPDGVVGVVGSVIESPSERVTGYTGTAERAVWSRMVFPVN